MRSSIELAWLREVVGRGGPPEPEMDPGGGGAAMPIVDAARGGTVARLARLAGGLIPLVSDEMPELDCGRMSDERAGTRLPAGGSGAGVVIRDGGPLGGGGVARTDATPLLGSFLFTHFFSSLS
jgi:hypothetical protein